MSKDKYYLDTTAFEKLRHVTETVQEFTIEVDDVEHWFYYGRVGEWDYVYCHDVELHEFKAFIGSEKVVSDEFRTDVSEVLDAKANEGDKQ